MADLKMVKSGDPLRIPAARFNTMLDAARDFQQHQQGREQTSFPAFRSSGIVLVRNDSGSDRERFDMLGIDAPVTPAYRGALFNLTGKVNAAAFKGLAAGQCLFLGASGSERGGGRLGDHLYWLGVQVTTSYGQWGWKTADVDSYPEPSTGQHFLDDAVWAMGFYPPGEPDLIGWNELADPITEESIDVAFVITPELATLSLLALGGLAVFRKRT